MKRDAAILALLIPCLFLVAAGCSKGPVDAPGKAESPLIPEASDDADPAKAGAEPDVLNDQTARGRVLAAWTGDLDGMIQRRVIRVLTAYSKTQFFVDQGTQRGLVSDTASLFEESLNKKLKKKNVRIHVLVIASHGCESNQRSANRCREAKSMPRVRWRSR